jgi:polar amino acid transport system substrate-binding protein
MLFSAWITCAAGPVVGKHVSLCADLWCPYNCVPGTDRPGFVVEIAQIVFPAAGYRLDYKLVNWARCKEDARAGRFSGIIGTIPDEAPDFTFPHTPIGISADSYAVRMNDDFRYKDTHSFDGRVLGVVREYVDEGEVGAYVAAHSDDPGRVAFASGDRATEKNLAKLAAGRIDVVLDDDLVLQNDIAELGLSAKLKVVRGSQQGPVFVAFSKVTPDRQVLADIWDRGVATLRASGRLDAIMARYHVPARQ